MSDKSTDFVSRRIKRDPDFVKAEAAMKRAAKKARQRAKQVGSGVMILKDGLIVEDREDLPD